MTIHFQPTQMSSGCVFLQQKTASHETSLWKPKQARQQTVFVYDPIEPHSSLSLQEARVSAAVSYLFHLLNRASRPGSKKGTWAITKHTYFSSSQRHLCTQNKNLPIQSTSWKNFNCMPTAFTMLLYGPALTTNLPQLALAVKEHSKPFWSVHSWLSQSKGKHIS